MRKTFSCPCHIIVQDVVNFNMHKKCQRAHEADKKNVMLVGEHITLELQEIVEVEEEEMENKFFFDLN